MELQHGITKIHLGWSGGKDSLMAYAILQMQYPGASIYLHTYINTQNQRVGLHGIHAALLQQQANILGLPLRLIGLPPTQDNTSYEATTLAFYQDIKRCGFTHVAFGDLHLEDLKAYREQLVTRAGLQAIFPLWKYSQAKLKALYDQLGIRAKICAIDTQKLGMQWCGIDYDPEQFQHLQKTTGIDPFGENGEFHTFVYDCCYMKNPLPICYLGHTIQYYRYLLANGTLREHAYCFAELELSTV